MLTVYTFDDLGIYSGSVSVDPHQRMPRGTQTPPPPTSGGEVAQWHGSAGWVVLAQHPSQLPQLISAKNAEINAARLAANFSTFAHGGKQFACDQLSRSDIDGTNGFVSLYGTLPPGWPGGWKAIDNSYAPIATVTDWKAFYASMFAAGNANFAHAQALKALLAAASTADEVAAIHWGMPT